MQEKIIIVRFDADEDPSLSDEYTPSETLAHTIGTIAPYMVDNVGVQMWHVDDLETDNNGTPMLYLE